jgi:hypothetical protein
VLRKKKKKKKKGEEEQEACSLKLEETALPWAVLLHEVPLGE